MIEAMHKVELAEVLDIAQYERERQAFRRRIIDLKKRRRLSIGPSVTLVFENHDTVLSQVQEMMRAERIVDENAIQHELDTYNALLPEARELAATMFIELAPSADIRSQMSSFYGVNSGDVTYLQIGSERVPALFASGQSDESRISAVQYLRFRLTDEQQNEFLSGSAATSVVIDHPNYRHRATLPAELLAELQHDLASE